MTIFAITANLVEFEFRNFNSTATQPQRIGEKRPWNISLFFLPHRDFIIAAHPQLLLAIIYFFRDNDREFIQLNFATEYRFTKQAKQAVVGLPRGAGWELLLETQPMSRGCEGKFSLCGFNGSLRRSGVLGASGGRFILIPISD